MELALVCKKKRVILQPRNSNTTIMATLNLTLNIPCENERINIAALKAELIAFAKIIISSPSVSFPKKKEEEEDPFAELDTSWGGDRDANEIADELHDMRSCSRTVDAW